MKPKVLIVFIYLSLATLFGYSQDKYQYFYASSQVDTLGNVPGSAGTTTLSIEMWVNLTTYNNQDCFFSKNLGSTNDYFMFDMANASNVRASLGTPSANYGKTTSDVIYTSEWFHMAVVYNGAGTTDSARLKVFVNGLQARLTFKDGSNTTIPTSIVSSNQPVTLGAKYKRFQIQQQYTGYMDEFRMWNIALTETQIQARMNETLNGNEPGLITYLPLDEADTAQTAPNLVNSTYNGKLLGFPDSPSPPTTPYWTTRTYGEPGTQATNITAENIYTTQMDILWDNGSGSARTVFMSTSTTGSPVPVDGTTYTPSANFGSGTQIGTTGWYCIYNGSGSEQRLISGLTANTEYRFMVCDYNGTAGNEDYIVSTSTGNPANLTTHLDSDPPASAPSAQSTDIFCQPESSTATINWAIGDGVRRAVFIMDGNSGTASPTDATTYTANTEFGSGDQIGSSGWYCVYDGTESSVDVTGLTSSSDYRVMVVEYNVSGGSEYYQTSTGTNNPVNFTTKPEVSTTSPVTNIWATKATFSGDITVGGGESVTGRGFIYSTTDGFDPITEGTTIDEGSTGSGSFSKTLDALTLSMGTNYYVRAYATNATGTSYGSQVSFTTDNAYFWTGASSTAYATAANWENNATPSAGISLYIPSGLSNYPSIAADVSSPAECNNLTIASGATVTVPSGKGLTVSGTLTSNSNGGLIIDGGVSGSGSLIYASGTPNATVKRYIANSSAGNADWHLVAPVTHQCTGGEFYIGASNDAWLTYLTETNNTWNFIPDTGTSLTRGVGYFYLIDENSPAKTIEFTGTLLAADLSSTLDYSGAAQNQGFNALGNPYASALDWDIGTWVKTNTTGFAYVYDATYNEGDFRVSGGDLTDGIIPMGQGFLVQATAAASFTIPEDGRVHSTQTFYKSTEEELSLKVRLQLDGNGYGNTVFVGFPDNGTSGLDFAGDATKVYSSTTTPQIFVVENNRELCINANAPLTIQGKTVPLHMVQVVDGNYTFTISQLDQLPDATVELEDLKTGAKQELNQNPVYSFSASEFDDPARFLLHFKLKPGGLEDPATTVEENLNIYSLDKNLYIESKGEAINQSGTVELYDIYGRTLLKKQINAQELVIVPVGDLHNFMLVRVIKKDFIKTQKVYIKN